MDKQEINNILNRLENYKNSLDFKHEYYGKDLKNNFKFISNAIKRFLKQGMSFDEINRFLNDSIEVYDSSYGLLIKKYK